MKLKKPSFWDAKKPNFTSYFLLLFTLPLIINNFFLGLKSNKKKNSTIKTICIGNIYIGGTAKTPLTIKISQILNKLNYKTSTIKKFYDNQIDEQKLLANKTNLFCYHKRETSLNKAMESGADFAIFDDGLQDRNINYDLSFVCFNSINLIGNGFLIPAGPLREKIKSISKYDAVFLNGNEEDVSDFKILIKKYNSNIKIFETYYVLTNSEKFNKNDKYIIFSGIGNPASFKKTLIKNKFNVIKEIEFPDHYDYSKNDIQKIKLHAKNLNAKILTTEKDFVKLNPDDTEGIKFLTIDLIIKREDLLINFLKLNT